MKSKKRHVGTKTKKRNTVVAIFLGFVIVVSVYHFLWGQSQTVSSGPFQFKAVIVDQLSLTAPDQAFIETATSILKQAGFAVDYYPGENVTIEFYRNLPAHNYGLIILRVHTTGGGLFFTSESYSQSSYVWEQLNDQIHKVSFDGNPPFYFGIPPSFIKSCMNGRFSKSVVVAMGCDSLASNDMAVAFIQKGAEAYIGWNEHVSADHTDQATIHVLQHLITQKQTIEKTVESTMAEVGPDSDENGRPSTLFYYPLEAGVQTIRSISNEN